MTLQKFGVIKFLLIALMSFIITYTITMSLVFLVHSFN